MIVLLLRIITNNIFVVSVIHIALYSNTSSQYRIWMTTQQEIDDMLQDSWCASSTMNNNQDENRNSHITQKQPTQSQNFRDSYEDYSH